MRLSTILALIQAGLDIAPQVVRLITRNQAAVEDDNGQPMPPADAVAAIEKAEATRQRVADEILTRILNRPE